MNSFHGNGTSAGARSFIAAVRIDTTRAPMSWLVRPTLLYQNKSNLEPNPASIPREWMFFPVGCCHHTADRHSMQRCSYCSSTSRGSSRSSRSTIATSDSRTGSNKNALLGVFDIIARRAKSGKLRGGRMSILFPPGMVRICSPCRFQLRDARERVLRRYFDADIAM